ncbi:MAG: nuclear transport factor 2 family protein [Rhodospirillaceae bacterium]|nr:MAG: nuclear transport factor 2 family protein [Rhodospirillaceae bacterium]
MSTLLEDKDAIRDLLANYCFYTDRKNPDALVALFTEDCVYDGGAFGRFEGRAALRGFMTAAGDESRVRHFTVNEVIAVKGDTATARSYFLVLDSASAPPTPLFTGFYEDQFVRTGGRWLFKTRTSLLK